jgi:rhamnose transport system permease protein
MSMSINQVPKPRRRLADLPWADAVLLVALLIAFVVMSQLSPAFLTASNLFEVTRFSAEIGFLALGMTLVIITGGIDLSVGAVLGLSGIVLGLLTTAGVNIWLATLLAIAVGALCGTLNGLAISRIGIPPLIVTLATLAVFRGFSLGLSQGRSFGDYPDAFAALGQGYVGPIPIQLLILAAVGIIVGLLLHRHSLGRLIYALGNNATAARFAGAPVGMVQVVVYALSGLLAGLAGVIYTARLSSARADAGTGFELDAITAVVLGGTAIMGGSGSVVGTMLGLLLVGVIRNGLTLAFVPAEQQAIVLGLILLFAVLLNQFLRARRTGTRT